MAFSLKTSAHSEIGLVRNNNQDSALTSPSLIVVADGMGGAAAGDLASAVAIRELRRADTANRPSEEHPDAERLVGEQMLTALSGALSRANDSLADLVVWDHSLEGMGTTVCGAMFSGTQYGIAHIGDSRGYLVRDGEFSRLTHDHSWVQSLVDEGRISLEEAAEHPHRSLLLKVLNGQPTHTPDFMLLDAQLGDRLLFCSDGLCGMIDDDQIEQLLTADADLDAIVESLTQAARDSGGLDNITLVVADVVEHDETLESAGTKVLGAAALVDIPKVDRPAPIDLGEVEDTHRIEGHVPMAPAPLAHGADIPDGAIDPDRFESIRYTPHLPSRRRRLMPLISSILAVLVLVIGGLFAVNQYASSRYYIGAEDDRVAIYQGLPDPILGWPEPVQIDVSTVNVADLPPYYAGQVRDRQMTYGSQQDAQEQLVQLGQMAERCIAEREAKATPSPSPPATTTSPGASPGRGSSSGAATSTSTPGAPATTSSPQISPRSTPTALPKQPTGTGSERPDLEACG